MRLRPPPARAPRPAAPAKRPPTRVSVTSRPSTPRGSTTVHSGSGAPRAFGTFEATAYGPPWGGIQGEGVTATGADLRGSPHDYIIAVDPSVIPLGAEVQIHPNPFGNDDLTFKAADTGGAITGHRIDIYDWRGRASQDGWGRRSVQVFGVGAKVNAEPTPAPKQAYFNPLRDAHVTAERIDQGVDYAGSGALVAIAAGVVTASVKNGSGWEGEAYLEYKVTEPGELSDHYIYYAEGIDPTVDEGDHIQGGQRVATLRASMPHGIELGFAAGHGEMSLAREQDGTYVEGTATRAGVAFSNLVRKLGGPGGKIEGEVVGTFPSFMPTGEPSPGTTNQPETQTGSQPPAPLPSAASYGAQYQFPDNIANAWIQLDRGASNGEAHADQALARAQSIDHVEKSDS